MKHASTTDNSTADIGQSDGREISTYVARLTSFQPSMGNFGRNRLTHRAPAEGLHSDTRVSNTRRCSPCPPSSAPPWSPPSRPSAPCAPPAWSPPAPRPSPSPRPRCVFFPCLPLHLAIVFRGGRPRRGARCRLGSPRVRSKDRANRWLRYVVGLHGRRVPRSRA